MYFVNIFVLLCYSATMLVLCNDAGNYAKSMFILKVMSALTLSYFIIIILLNILCTMTI